MMMRFTGPVDGDNSLTALQKGMLPLRRGQAAETADVTHLA